MGEYVLCFLLAIIAVCLIIIAYLFFKLQKNNKPDAVFIEDQPKNSVQTKTLVTDVCAIPDDVVFDERNLPVRTTRSMKRKVNFGKDFNAYLVKGGTLYHKKSCKKLKGKKYTTKHIYECIADKNKRACPICNPRTETHDWYKAKFPDSVYVKATEQYTNTEQLSLFDYAESEDAQ